MHGLRKYFVRILGHCTLKYSQSNFLIEVQPAIGLNCYIVLASGLAVLGLELALSTYFLHQMALNTNKTRYPIVNACIFRQPIDLDYFEEAVDFILSLKEVDSSKGVGVCGISKGNLKQYGLD